MKVFSSFVFMLILFSTPIVAASADETGTNNFEVTNNVDLKFFLNPPKLPWGVDPFLKEPGFAEVKRVDEPFVLNGIFYSENTPTAIVNGKKVKTGDLVGDRRVEEIGENFVILKKKNSEIEINLPPLAEESENEN
jgi:hypothetical protein